MVPTRKHGGVIAGGSLAYTFYRIAIIGIGVLFFAKRDVTLPDAPGSYHRPSAPFCLSGYKFSRTHTCSDWEISRYQSEIEEYVSKLRTFANEAVEAANEAIRFAEDAKAHAKCEAEDVIGELK